MAESFGVGGRNVRRVASAIGERENRKVFKAATSRDCDVKGRLAAVRTLVAMSYMVFTLFTRASGSPWPGERGPAISDTRGFRPWTWFLSLYITLLAFEATGGPPLHQSTWSLARRCCTLASDLPESLVGHPRMGRIYQSVDSERPLDDDRDDDLGPCCAGNLDDIILTSDTLPPCLALFIQRTIRTGLQCRHIVGAKIRVDKPAIVPFPSMVSEQTRSRPSVKHP